MNTRRCLPAPAGRISTSSARRRESFSTTGPANSSSRSITTSSTGSRLWPVCGSTAQQHARAADRELEALAPHGLDQHGELQLAAAGDLEGVAAGRRGDPDRDVALGLAPQPLGDHARADLAALLAGERRIVDREGHRERRRVDRLRRQRRLDAEIAERVGDGRAIEARERHDVAGRRLLERRAARGRGTPGSW